ncbi:hypothetical protein C7H19_15255 [Aphanothece hegewaldii CCALA 016]|uniref:Uncharacterized protein n=1 Tax=Aphanothece hegewaldii CCALA 016 TaxID=2107694 RepID=A0A2T1LVL8_9CHRO|nr:hypothetical protein [Aphanothece hegewaldii]PSF35781.1 hypothetical protein C7H19_15255 [Aphanothece hegewaldii CCALA 016]
MNKSRKIPSVEQVQQTVAKSRRRRQELELACLELEDFILKLEEIKIHQRRQQLKKTFNPH